MSGLLVSMSSAGIKKAILITVLSTLVSSLAFSPNFVSNVSTAQSSSSASEVHSDFNGDGYEDLAIGSRLEDLGALEDAGVVNVLYGSQSGLQSISPAAQLWSQNTPEVNDNAEVGDFFGSTLAPGDFNGDGFDDLAIGVPHEELGSLYFGGGVNVLYGSSAGLRASPASDGSGRADQFWTPASPGINIQVAHIFGASLSAGDFNGDGKDDLAIGVGADDKVVVLYGSGSGLQTSSPADQLWTQDSPGVEDTAEANDGFGHDLVAADFNGDSFSDLAIGVMGEGIEPIFQAGAVNVLYGSSSGLRASPAADGTGRADQFWTQDSPGVENEVEEGSEGFGWLLGAGDFNGDGNDDLAIGVGSENINGLSLGCFHVIYGSSSGLQTSSPPDQFWTQDSPGVEGDAEEGDNFAFQFGTNDFNDDGFGDLAIGVPDEDIGTKRFAGAVNVLYGSSSGLQTTSPADQFWHQNRVGVEEDAQDRDEFGFSSVGGDFNGDGLGDLAIGVPGESIGAIGRAGGVNVLYGSLSGLQTTSPADQFWSQNSPGVPETAEERDRFGYAMGFYSELV